MVHVKVPPGTHVCPAEGCGMAWENVYAVPGPHLAMHRRRGDPGVPPPRPGTKAKNAARRKAKQNGKALVPARRPRPRMATTDVGDAVLMGLYPVSVPTHRVRRVAEWLAATDRLAAEAWIDNEQEEP